MFYGKIGLKRPCLPEYVPKFRLCVLLDLGLRRGEAWLTVSTLRLYCQHAVNQPLNGPGLQYLALVFVQEQRSGLYLNNASR